MSVLARSSSVGSGDPTGSVVRGRRVSTGNEVEPVAFLEREYSPSEARIRVEVSLAEGRPHYWIQWWEPDAGRGIGWHADETVPEYGPVHFQIEYADGTTERREADDVEDEHPCRTFERRFTSVPGKLSHLGWD